MSSAQKTASLSGLKRPSEIPLSKRPRPKTARLPAKKEATGDEPAPKRPTPKAKDVGTKPQEQEETGPQTEKSTEAGAQAEKGAEVDALAGLRPEIRAVIPPFIVVRFSLQVRSFTITDVRLLGAV